MLSQLCHTIASFNNLPKLCHVERHFALNYISPSDFFHIKQERLDRFSKDPCHPTEYIFFNSVCKLSVDTDILTNMFSSKCVQIFWVHSLMNMFFSKCVQIFWAHPLTNMFSSKCVQIFEYTVPLTNMFSPRRITRTRYKYKRKEGLKRMYIYFYFICFHLRYRRRIHRVKAL